jgi:hypothetical protein
MDYWKERKCGWAPSREGTFERGVVGWREERRDWRDWGDWKEIKDGRKEVKLDEVGK